MSPNKFRLSEYDPDSIQLPDEVRDYTFQEVCKLVRITPMMLKHFIRERELTPPTCNERFNHYYNYEDLSKLITQIRTGALDYKSLPYEKKNEKAFERCKQLYLQGESIVEIVLKLGEEGYRSATPPEKIKTCREIFISDEMVRRWVNFISERLYRE